jgi:hypothetical protein
MAKRTAQEIERDMLAFQEPSDGNWMPLDALITEAVGALAPADQIRLFLRLFERFPFDDGAGVMWAALHALEDLDGYEASLLLSVRRTPSELGLAMLGRLFNAGQISIGEANIFDVFADLAAAGEIDERARKEAARWLRRVQSKQAPNG